MQSLATGELEPHAYLSELLLLLLAAPARQPSFLHPSDLQHRAISQGARGWGGVCAVKHRSKVSRAGAAAGRDPGVGRQGEAGTAAQKRGGESPCRCKAARRLSCISVPRHNFLRCDSLQSASLPCPLSAAEPLRSRALDAVSVLQPFEIVLPNAYTLRRTPASITCSCR